ncbi:hypothetical protein ACIRU8_06850 [Streptomyces sp. NPDC101175]|uniref:hypothetical protein n=1 Tax=Streptomyces sp. NPDC101175 TaxID=3366123 RepID=UPI0038396876
MRLPGPIGPPVPGPTGPLWDSWPLLPSDAGQQDRPRIDARATRLRHPTPRGPRKEYSHAQHSGEPAKPSADLGLPAASALVIGSVVGTGVFALPSALAAYGPISVVAFVVVTLALVLTFGALSKKRPALRS